MTKQERIRTANAFLETVATCGHRFFNYTGKYYSFRGAMYTGHISRFEMDARGHVYLRSGYTGARCFRRPKFYGGKGAGLAWYGRKFPEGGTLNQLCQALDDFIRTGKPQRMNLGPWLEWYCNGDLWGYKDDMELVREAARDTGVWDEFPTAPAAAS